MRKPQHPFKKQFLSTDQGRKAKGQHTVPCADCPWTRKSINGWLGGIAIQFWLKLIHGEAKIDCHVMHGAECAGAAIYRANVCKQCISSTILQLPPDHTTVFSSPMEFEAHHQKPLGKKA